MTTIDRKYITLTEEFETGYSLYDSSRVERRWWVAIADGPLSTGESVRVARDGDTAGEAYEALEAALKQQNWEIA